MSQQVEGENRQQRIVFIIGVPGLIASINAHLASHKQDLDDSLSAIGKTAEMVTANMVHMIQEMDAAMSQDLRVIDIKLLGCYPPAINPPKRSRRSRRGHNSALDRIIT